MTPAQASEAARQAYQASVNHQITAIGRPEQPFRQWEDLDEPTREYWNAVAQACLAPERARVKRRIEVLTAMSKAAIRAASAQGTKAEDMFDDQAVQSFAVQTYEMMLLAHHLGIELPEGLPIAPLQPGDLELARLYPEVEDTTT